LFKQILKTIFELLFRIITMRKLIIGIIFQLILLACQPFEKGINMETNDHKKFSCSVETGLCSEHKHSDIEEIQIQPINKVTVLYYTDPICSACWAIEPELKKLKLMYGDYMDIEYRMGGLLPQWEGFADSGNGISGPKDVAIHWDEVGEYSGMSINGDVWLEDPLHSSYPPSIAFKAMQEQGYDISIKFLRRIREMVFLEKKNITKEIHLSQAVRDCGGNVEKFLIDYKDPASETAFKADLMQGRRMGVRSFPTFLFLGEDGKGFKISGMSHFDNFVSALEKARGEKVHARSLNWDALELLRNYSLLSTKELAVLLDRDQTSMIKELEEAELEGKVKEHIHKFGSFWSLIN